MSTQQQIHVWIEKNKALLFWTLITALSSVGHYVHNVIHFEHYPEPEWLNPEIVDAFWFFMTPFALIGLYFSYKERIKEAVICLTLYSLMNMLTLLHYACEVKVPITFAIHFFIWLEAICALILLFYIFKELLIKRNR